MAEKLAVYNRALAHLKEERLSSLTERRSPRYKLDDQWDDCVAYCLQKGFWKFAIKTAKLTKDGSYAPTFGYDYRFQIPTDLARLIVIAGDDRFREPFDDYREETGYWYADVDELYARYVSNHASYGLNLTKWPPSFVELVSLRLAGQAGPGISNKEDLVNQLRRDEKSYRIDAQSIDAMGDPVMRPRTGSWVRSRLGGRAGGEFA